MNPRELALHAYYLGTLKARANACRRFAENENAPLCVLFYHRVADSHPNSWSISNREFERQMRWLQRHVDLVSLEEIQKRMIEGRNERVAVAITFDDGYAENCDRAIPFLLREQIPFTYFVALDFIVNGRPFPQDVAAGTPLAPNTPEQIRRMAVAGVEIGAHTRTHCNVGQIDSPDKMIDEIVTASDQLGDLIECPVRYFAFPYGKPEHLSAAAARLAAKSGMLGVCSAYGAYNLPGDDPFHIQRIHGDPEFIRLKNWITVDQRKMKLGRSFVFPETAVSSLDIDQAMAATSGSVRSAISGLQPIPGITMPSPDCLR